MPTSYSANAPCRFFVVAPQALVPALQVELARLGARQARPLVGGVMVQGPLELGYRLCLWSRLASRVLLQLAEVPARNGDTLYQACRNFHWEDHLSPSETFAIRFNGESPEFRHSHFGALRIKDALCDRFRELTGQRPSVDREHPQLQFSAFLRQHRVTLYLELSGEPLHRRGYRLSAGQAPLKETLAAGILAMAGWQPQAQPAPLVDPMCGSGTLLFEGLMMALDLPTGLWRERFGFEAWKGHQAILWQGLRREASEHRDRQLSAPRVLAWGYDPDAAAIHRAQRNAERLGMSGFFQFQQQAVDALQAPAPDTGLVVTNPPYGERLGDLAGVAALYRVLGERLRAQFAGWRFAMITSNADLAAETGLQPEQQFDVRNGAIDCVTWVLTVPVATQAPLPVLDDARLQEWRAAFANRLAKNRRRLQGWLKQSGTTAWRLYDADIPEFSVAIDVYDGYFHVAEYAPPAQVNSVHAAWRLKLVQEVLCEQEGASPDRIILKTRERQRGASQYTRQGSGAGGLVVCEGVARYRVNLTDYLDTGLFLDHRPVRRLVHDLAVGKRFLNLFCYTATVTVQAALGGAVSSLSVDMSNTYLDWAEDNFQLNGLDCQQHRLERADCLSWLSACRESFDVILLDPPSFSNSKRMDATLDVQRDHPRLVDECMRCLAPGGVLLFSTNRRKFRLDPALAGRYRVEDITKQTLDPDFNREPPIHRCWRITHH